MLGVGIDWADEFHDIALGTPEKGVIKQFRIEHGPAGVHRLIARCPAVESGPGRGTGGAGDAARPVGRSIAGRGFTLDPVNPDSAARRRGPARKKDDAEDARICCLIALDRHAALKPLVSAR